MIHALKHYEIHSTRTEYLWNCTFFKSPIDNRAHNKDTLELYRNASIVEKTMFQPNNCAVSAKFNIARGRKIFHFRFFRASFEIRTSPVFDDTIMKRAVSLTGKGSFYVAWRMDRQWTKNLVDRPPGMRPRARAAPPRRMASVKKTLWAHGTLLHGFTEAVSLWIWGYDRWLGGVGVTVRVVGLWFANCYGELDGNVKFNMIM